jgi:hypothetical protein
MNGRSGCYKFGLTKKEINDKSNHVFFSSKTIDAAQRKGQGLTYNTPLSESNPCPFSPKVGRLSA